MKAVLLFRGSKHNFDNWEKQFGAKGWSYQEVLPYFIKYENITGNEILQEWEYYHGTEGPVKIALPKATTVENEFFDWIKKFGYKFINDINGPQYGPKTGGMVGQTLINGQRLSTSAAYLEPKRNQNNLHILTNSHATKILFEDVNNPLRASGVQFFRDGKYFKVNATREVIISGGVINSPQLLMLSGMGPKSHLNALGIQVLVDLPVGDNFHDGICSSKQSVRDDEIENRIKSRSITSLTTEDLYNFYNSGTGPLAGPWNRIVIAFNTKYNNDTEWPDAGFRGITKDGFLSVYLLRPLSRGKY